MANKAVLNRQIQLLEEALLKLNKVNNELVNDINNNIRCPECRKVMIEHTKNKQRGFMKMQASLLGAIYGMGGTDYSAEPYKLFSKEK